MKLIVGLVTLLPLIIVAFGRTTNKQKSIYETIDKARLDKKSYDAMHNVHMNWYNYAIKALLGQMGKQLYKHLQPEERVLLAACLQTIDEKSDIQEGAKCLVKIRKKARAKLPNGGCNNGELDYLFCNELESSFMVEEDDESGFITDDQQESAVDSATDMLSTVAEHNATVQHSFQNASSVERKPIDTTNMSTSIGAQHLLSNAEPIKQNSLKRSRTSEANEPIYSSQKSAENNVRHDQSRIDFTNENVNSKHAKSSYSSTQIYNGQYITATNITAMTADSWQYNIEQQKKHKISTKLIKRFHELRRRPFLSRRKISASKLPVKSMKQIKILYQNHISDNDKDTVNCQHHRKMNMVTLKRQILCKYSNPSKAAELQRRRRMVGLSAATVPPSLSEHVFGEQYKERKRRNAFDLSEKRTKELTEPKLKIMKMDSLNEISSPPQKSPIQKFASLLRVAVRGSDTTESKEWMNSYKKLLDFKRQIDENKKLPGAKVYQKRLYDIIIDDTESKKQSSPLPDYLASAFALVESYGKRKRNQKNMNFKFLSPRFGSLMPDKMESASKILSPSLFSFYEDNSNDNLVPVPKLLREAGIDENDQESMMDVLMDITGAKDTVDATLEIAKKMNITGMNDELYEATVRFDKAFKELESSFNRHQKNEIDRDGFTFLDAIQLETLMKKHGVNDPKAVEFDIDEYKKQSKKQRHIGLWKTIEAFARNKTRRRSKRAWLSVLGPVVLSPYMFAPIFGLTVLGPVVLSPSIFSPLILNPAVMAPYILSPGLFMPFIISPYVLSPYILTPLLGAPFVLSPYALSPNILNPYLMSPLILSPYILSPDILSPQALGGPILSPSAFSPAVLTESFLMVSFLSPTFMS